MNYGVGGNERMQDERQRRCDESLARKVLQSGKTNTPPGRLPEWRLEELTLRKRAARLRGKTARPDAAWLHFVRWTSWQSATERQRMRRDA